LHLAVPARCRDFLGLRLIDTELGEHLVEGHGRRLRRITASVGVGCETRGSNNHLQNLFCSRANRRTRNSERKLTVWVGPRSSLWPPAS
jgi:hypothetical protein